MRKIRLMLTGVVLAGLFASCSDDSSDTANTVNGNATAVINNMKSGTWKITSFTEDGKDETNNFTGYAFTFGTDGVVKAASSSSAYQGTWSVLEDKSDDDNKSDDIDFIIAFTSPKEFTDLSDDWHVQERTGVKITLTDVSGSNSGTDTLVFEKK